MGPPDRRLDPDDSGDSEATSKTFLLRFASVSASFNTLREGAGGAVDVDGVGEGSRSSIDLGGAVRGIFASATFEQDDQSLSRGAERDAKPLLSELRLGQDRLSSLQVVNNHVPTRFDTNVVFLP